MRKAHTHIHTESRKQLIQTNVTWDGALLFFCFCFLFSVFVFCFQQLLFCWSASKPAMSACLIQTMAQVAVWPGQFLFYHRICYTYSRSGRFQYLGKLSLVALLFYSLEWSLSISGWVVSGRFDVLLFGVVAFNIWVSCLWSLCCWFDCVLNVLHECMHTYGHTHVHALIHTHTHIHMLTCVHQIYTAPFIHLYTWTYICTCTHTHTCLLAGPDAWRYADCSCT
jgi:hypothetical protein